jgi:superfamily II DNA or RNA helicase
MEKEFPEFNHNNYQQEFLEDWWSRKKLFKGTRQSGKTTLILMETKRMIRSDMDCLVLVPTQSQIGTMKQTYQKIFGSIPLADFASFSDLRDGYYTGSKFDAVLIDEGQHLSLDLLNREIFPMDFIFLRMTVPRENYGDAYLSDETVDSSELFDSVYKV